MDKGIVMSNLKALAAGKQLVDADGNILHIKGVVLGLDHQEINESTDYDMQQLDELKIYVNPMQEEVDRLQIIIDRLTADLVLANTPIVKGTYKHLSIAEVRDIEMIFEKDINADANLIISTYGTSQPVVSRIRAGKHSKTSSNYTTHLLQSNG